MWPKPHPALAKGSGHVIVTFGDVILALTFSSYLGSAQPLRLWVTAKKPSPLQPLGVMEESTVKRIQLRQGYGQEGSQCQTKQENNQARGYGTLTFVDASLGF